MKQICILILFASQFLLGSELRSSPAIVTQEIRFRSEDAREIFLVWGINDWKLQDTDLLPQGSYIKNKLMYTPMRSQDGVFTVQLKVRRGAMIDYVFWISKGPANLPTDIWDI